MRKGTGGVRAIALVGPGGSGKTTLLEALAVAAGGSGERQGERLGGLGGTRTDRRRLHHPRLVLAVDFLDQRADRRRRRGRL